MAERYKQIVFMGVILLFLAPMLVFGRGDGDNDDDDKERGSSRPNWVKEKKDKDDDQNGRYKNPRFILNETPTVFPNISPTISPSPTPKDGKWGKRRFCEAKQHAIKQRLEHLVRMANNMVSVFERITDRVKKFYETKVVPKRGEIAQYPSLLDDIEAKKAAVQAAVAQAQQAAGSFSCSSENPKAAMKDFRLKMQAVKQALKAYRTSVRNLIVAVRRRAPLEGSPSPSPSPTASVSPPATPEASPTPTPTPTPSPTPSLTPSPTP